MSTAVLIGLAVLGSTSNHTVDWSSVSHVAWQDRRPLCPVDRQGFEVRFQTGKDDLTAARVLVTAGSTFGVHAAKIGSRGPYDLWAASVPASAVDAVSYVIELTDGSDTDYLGPLGMSDLAPASGFALNFATLEHAPVGATPIPTGGAVFKVWAPSATSAAVRGTFNNWGLSAMTRRGEHFIARVNNATPGHDYKFYFNARDWRPDARARFLDNADNYNSTIIDPLAYAWRTDFTPDPREQWVVYQLHIGTFAGLNDPKGSFTRPATYREVAARADHLAELGVNAVMINPINEFPGQLSGGYNSISQWAFESTHGSPDDLKFLIDELHARGIAVMLDVVWNHFPSNDNYLWNYDGFQTYFDTPAVGTPWGPQADVDRQGVYDYFLDSVDHVLGEFRMNGYRHDAVYELVSATQFQSGQRLVRAMTDQVHRRYADAHVIGEIYNNSAWNTSPSGMNLDGQYHEAFKNAIKDAIDSAAFGDPNLARLAGAIDGSGPWVDRSRVFNYYELHDEAWSLSGAGRTRAVKQIDTSWPHDDRYATGRTKLGNGLTLLAQGMPAILMGTEWLEDNGWEQQKIDWSHRVTYAPIFRFYQDLVRLRTTEPALFAESDAGVYHVNDAANVLAFSRSRPGADTFVVVANFSNTDLGAYTVGLPDAGCWSVELSSEATIYRGRGVGQQAGPVTPQPLGYDGQPNRLTLSLPAHGFLLLRGRALPGDANADTTLDAFDFNAFVDAFNAGDLGLADQNSDTTLDAFDFNAFVDAFNAGCP